MKKNIKKKNKKIVVVMIIVIIVLIVYFYISQFKNNTIIENNEFYNIADEVAKQYNPYVITINDVFLYDSNLEKIGTISNEMYIELEDNNSKYSDGYYKLKNINGYIYYKDVKKTDEQKKNLRFLNYVPFNESIIISKNTKLYADKNSYYTVYNEKSLPIIVKDDDKYYVVFDNKLVYVHAEDVTTTENNNSNKEIAESVSVLNYHFVINKEAGEKEICSPASICHTDTQFDSHIKYISENKYYTINMKELELFIDGKINLPKKSVSITIDDGWFVSRAIPILEKYNVMGTLFLIGSLAPVSDYASNNLEIHSHTWNLHNVSNCKEGRSALLCYDKEKIVEDLLKSRESLNDTTYFCYPFYEYNSNAIESLKEAGFTMALTGGNTKVKKGINKFKVPRYVIYNTTTIRELATIIS